ncbi:MAG: hypothetical protein Q9222_002533, partial [Ikaeria aurantiellina]
MDYSIYEPMSWTHENEGRRRRDSKTTINTQPPPRYEARSPSRRPSYSTPSTSSAVPIPSAHSPHNAHLPSPKMNGTVNHSAIFDQRESNPSFYDAVSDHREGQASWNPHYHVASPTQDPRASPSTYHSPMSAQFPHHSPTAPTSHAHPPSSHNSISQSPLQTAVDPPVHRRTSSYYTETNGTPAHNAHESSYSNESRRESQSKAREDSKASNPMSFSNILSSNAADVPSTTPHALPPAKQFRKTPSIPNGDVGPPSAMFRRSSQKSTLPVSEYSETPKLAKEDVCQPRSNKIPKPKTKFGPSTSDKENDRIQKEIKRIDAMELSDIESPDWSAAKQDYAKLSSKRLLEVEGVENNKRK